MPIQYLNSINAANVRNSAFRAVGNGIANDTNAIIAAMKDEAAAGLVYFPPGVYRIRANLTFPAGITSRFANGAMIKTDSGVIVTFNGPVEAELTQIFSGDGSIAGLGLEEYVYPQWWGAAADDSTDDTAAFQAALNTGRPVYVTKGIYRINKSLEYRNNSAITIIGEEGAVIDGTASRDTYLIHLGGERGKAVPLASNAAAGANTIKASIAAVPGDILLISSTDLWNINNKSHIKGEMVEINSISGSDIMLKSSLYDSYNASTTKVYKLSMPTVTVERLDIRRNSNHAGLWVEYSRDLDIKHCVITGARERCFYVSYIYGGVIANNEASDCWYEGSGTSYGISISTVQNVTARGNQFAGGRHGIAHGGWEPCRNVIITENVIDNYRPSGQPSLDFHGNCEFNVVTRNLIWNGMIHLGRNVEISDNFLYGDQRSAINVWPSLSGDYTIIRNNIIDTVNASNTNSFGISYFAFSPNVTVDLVQIENNIIKSKTRSISIEPYTAAQTNIRIAKLLLINNEVTSNDHYALIIYKSNTTRWQIDEITISGGHYRSVGHCMLIDVVPDNNRLSIRNASVITDKDNANPIDSMTGIKDAIIENSYLGGGKAAANKCNFNNTGILKIRETQFENFKAPQTIPDAVDFYESNNLFLNSKGTFTVNRARRLTEGYADGNVTGRGASAPTSGTWMQGDQIFNTSPTPAKNIAFWVCVAPGSPGSWAASGTGMGTSAQRPALTPNDTGYLYNDTTINKLLCWNGKSWV